MKKGHVCLFFMVVILMLCAFSYSDTPLSAVVICPVTGNSFEITGDKCGPVKDLSAYCPYCKADHYFDVTLSHNWLLTDALEPTTETAGYENYICTSCFTMETVVLPVLPPEPSDPNILLYMNWLGSVLGLFSMTLDRIMSILVLRMFAGVLVFLTMFSLLAKLLQQGRKGRL